MNTGRVRREQRGLTENEMSDNTGEYEDAVDGERHEEEVEVAVVTLAHTVAHPRTVVVKPL